MAARHNDIPKFIVPVSRSSQQSVSVLPESRSSSVQIQRQQRRNSRPQSRRAKRGNPVRCNKCSTALTGTVFLLKCECILCEECTYSHFAKHKNCPSCNQVMGENDFTELMVRKAPTRMKQREIMYKRFFVKQNSQSKSFNLNDLWYRIQRQHLMVREGTKFVLRQFGKENSSQKNKASKIQRAIMVMKGSHDALKRENHKHKQKIEEYKAELILSHEKIDEKGRQLKQFRTMIDSQKNPSSSPRNSESYEDHHHQGGEARETMAGRESSSRPLARPRRVSDQYHVPPPSARGSSGRHSHRSYEEPRYHQKNVPRSSNGYTRDRANPYGEPVQPDGNRHSTQPPGNPYNGGLSPPSREHHNQHHRSQHSSQNPYHQTSTKPPSSRNPYYNQSGGKSVGSGGNKNGGKIRNISASTPYTFSGSDTERNKRSLSPSHSYALHHSQAPRGYHRQSY